MNEKKGAIKKESKRKQGIQQILKSQYDKRITLENGNSSNGSASDLIDSEKGLEVTKEDNRANGNISESVKVIDARSLVICVDNRWRIAKSDWVLWAINHMFRPFKPFSLKDKHLQVIEINDEKEPGWIDLEGNDKEQNKDMNKMEMNETKLKEKQGDKESKSTIDGKEGFYRILPHTKIYTFYKRYSLVFLLDMSSSLATIDPFRKTVLVNEIIETFKNCLFGCLDKFSIPQSQTNTYFEVKPEIYLSVLADYSNSSTHNNTNTKDNIKTLLHNIIVTKENLKATFDQIQKWFIYLQNIMANETTTIDSINNNNNNLNNNNSLNNNNNNDNNIIPDDLEDLLQQKEGQNSFLEYGLLTLRLMPQDAAPVLVLISDGVPEFKPMDYGYGLRGMAKEGVHLIAIQVGNPFGFTPASSFGYKEKKKKEKKKKEKKKKEKKKKEKKKKEKKKKEKKKKEKKKKEKKKKEKKKKKKEKEKEKEKKKKIIIKFNILIFIID
ncbi:hypothetical protein K502DRAFT_354040 [Neoconidiobolus thromboides FSU 785]|nr:hypothetical protein K502DRAFT_354040 [Neoconidiobolus thromboides FSU 785]